MATPFPSRGQRSPAFWDDQLKAYVDEGDDMSPRGEEGRSYGMFFAALRNTGTGWAPISDGSHEPTFVDSVSIDGAIVVSHTNLDAAKVGSVIAVPDEALTAAGFRLGCSVTPEETRITLYQDYTEVADYVSYNGSAWVSQNSQFAMAFAAGVLTLTHTADVGTSGSAAVSLTERGHLLHTCVTAGAGATTNTTLKIEFRDAAGTLLTTPTTDMKVFVRHGKGGGRVQIDPTTVDSTKYPLSNIWLLGVMQR